MRKFIQNLWANTARFVTGFVLLVGGLTLVMGLVGGVVWGILAFLAWAKIWGVLAIILLIGFCFLIPSFYEIGDDLLRNRKWFRHWEPRTCKRKKSIRIEGPYDY